MPLALQFEGWQALHLFLPRRCLSFPSAFTSTTTVCGLLSTAHIRCTSAHKVGSSCSVLSYMGDLGDGVPLQYMLGTVSRLGRLTRLLPHGRPLLCPNLPNDFWGLRALSKLHLWELPLGMIAHWTVHTAMYELNQGDVPAVNLLGRLSRFLQGHNNLTVWRRLPQAHPTYPKAFISSYLLLQP